MSASQDAPFRTIVSPPQGTLSLDSPDELVSGHDAWSTHDLEAAYQRALAAAEIAEQLVTEEIDTPAGAESISPTEPIDASDTVVEPVAAQPAVDAPESRAIPLPTATPKQVLEALLFVGGEPLTGKRLADLLGGGFTHEQVDELIAELNRQYSADGRPYEIRLAEGGYRLELSPEYEPVRSRVYGQGPRDVKLSQDVLEVLAFIAYRQPIDKAAIEETGKDNTGAILRQLLRRELISLERLGDDEQVRYRTTPRFLELFGLRDIDDLPQPDDLMFK